MDAKKDEILIQRYLLGDMEEHECRQFEGRLERDQRLRELLSEYRELIGDLRELDDPEVPEALWSRRIRPALEERLGNSPGVLERLRTAFGAWRGFMLKPAYVTAVFAVLLLVVTVLVVQLLERPQTPGEERVAQTLGRIENLRQQFQAELAVLIGEVEERRELMSPELRRLYDDTLARIDEAIADAERFYLLYPTDADAIEFLFAAYDRKGQFLQRFVNMYL